MKLRFFNTMGRLIQDFETLENGVVKMYCCGPTVYNYAHIGNLRAYLFDDILSSCNKKTRLCVACDITLETEFIQTKSVAAWKNSRPELHKRPTIFLIHA